MRAVKRHPRPKTNCCSKRSLRLSKIATVKATKAANVQVKKGQPKKKSSKTAAPKKAKGCVNCGKHR